LLNEIHSQKAAMGIKSFSVFCVVLEDCLCDPLLADFNKLQRGVSQQYRKGLRDTISLR
jgi:hypothetical protein